jgi:hypothetical protein
MLVVVAGLVLTAVLILKLGFRRGVGATNLGSMSPQWIAACQTSQQASSL